MESIVITVIASIISGVVATYITNKINANVKIRRINSSSSVYTQSLIDLYSSLFETKYNNYSPEDIVELIDEDTNTKYIQSENIVLVATQKKNVVGFIMAHFYASEEKAIISYYGIDETIVADKGTTASKLLSSLHRILNDGYHLCKYILFDVDGNAFSHPKDYDSRQNARIVRFNLNARSYGYKAYQFRFPYVSPKIGINDKSNERPCTLMCIPINAKIENPMSKMQVLDFVKFVYMNC